MTDHRFLPTGDEELFARTVRDVLDKQCGVEQVRAAWAPGPGRSDRLWSALAEVGVVGLLVPESAGGLGLGEDTLVVVLEECGRAAVPEPVLETTAVGAPLLAALGDPDALLPSVCAGRARLSVQLAGDPFAADPHVAAVLLAERDGAVYAVPPAVARLTAQPATDGSRRLFGVEWDPAAARRLADGRRAAEAVAAARDRGALATAALLVGLADRLVERAAGYAGQREQFGRPIGSFQAVKHLLADAHLDLQFARPMVHRAGWAMAAGDPLRSREVSAAKLVAARAATRAARAALQVHGAIGYSFEHDLHLWLKRVWALVPAWGDPAFHRARVAAALAAAGPARTP